MELWPLIKRQVNITELSLANAAITLLIKEEGIFIAGLPQAPDDGTANSDEETAPADIPINIDLQTFTLSNASILVKDMIADTEYTLTSLDVNASMKLENNQAILSTLKGDAVAMDKIDLKFSGTNASYDLASGTLSVETLSATSMDGTFILAGKSRPITLHEMTSLRSSASATQQQLCTQFSAALTLFKSGHWHAAQKAFSTLITTHQDHASHYYHQRCQEYQNTPPPVPWNGTINITQK